jgi:hypothetical protein
MGIHYALTVNDARVCMQRSKLQRKNWHSARDSRHWWWRGLYLELIYRQWVSQIASMIAAGAVAVVTRETRLSR